MICEARCTEARYASSRIATAPLRQVLSRVMQDVEQVRFATGRACLSDRWRFAGDRLSSVLLWMN
jgi:hypothetical protein